MKYRLQRVCEEDRDMNMLQSMECEMQGKVKQLIAFVKYDNIASQMVFKKSNYVEIKEKDYIKYSKNFN
jgi:hypothetical protein